LIISYSAIFVNCAFEAKSASEETCMPNKAAFPGQTVRQTLRERITQFPGPAVTAKAIKVVVEVIRHPRYVTLSCVGAGFEKGLFKKW
jgi:hypothetical protein